MERSGITAQAHFQQALFDMKSILTGQPNIIVCLLAIVMTSCGQRVQPLEYEVINPGDIKQAIEMIDSARLALTGFEPKEQGYQPNAYPFGVPTQETFDSATETWNTFVKLCQKDKFKKAYDLYNEDGKPGDFMICLKHSTNRYYFYRDVLRPMMYEFEDKDSADVKYLNLLKLEHDLGEDMMQNQLGNNDYIPETFPDLAFDLGVMLAERDRIDEALEMIGSFGYAVQGLYGNPAFTNFEITLYVAQVYYAAGDIEQAIETLEDYKKYTSEHRDQDRDPEEYDYYCSFVDGIIEDMSRQNQGLTK